MSADDTKTAMDIDKTATKIDEESIESMSFCPSTSQVGKLIDMANKAEEVRMGLNGIDGWRTDTTGIHNQKKISKLYGSPNLCPDSLNPNDTILAKFGRGKEKGGMGPGGLGDGNLRVINDLKMPFGADSCGPNGVLTNITNNRMNLFYNNKVSTEGLLNEYILFRDNNLYEIFEMFVKKITDMATSTKDIEKNMIFHETETEKDLGDLVSHYKNVKEMFQQVLKKCETDNKKSKEGLEGCGIGCVSFCQTWCLKERGEGDDKTKKGEAQFSVMSPHFQTRFHVINDTLLLGVGDVKQEHIDSYIKIIEHFDKIMSKNYGEGGGGPAFVHLDDLKAQFDKDTSNQTQTGQGKRKTKKNKRKTKKNKRKTKKNKSKRNGGKSKRNRKKTKKKRR